MRDFSRRQFIQSTLGGAGFALGAGLAPLGSGDSFAADRPEKPETKPDTLFLTWQRDPTTTMTVQWVGKEKEPAQAAISFTPLGKEKWQTVATADRAYPLSELRAFRAELTGLSPGTEYEFRVGDHKVPFRFRTMPTKATNSFSFISGGDCGVNPHTVANNQIAAKQDPMFAIVGGDLAYDDGKKIDTNLQFMRNYHDNMVDSEGRLIPMVVCIGNHEVNGGYNKPRADAPFFFALYDGLFSEHSYATLDFGDYLSLVLLDTAPRFADRRGTNRLARQGTAAAERPSALVRRESRAGVSLVPSDGRRKQRQIGHWRRQPQALGATVREAQCRPGVGTPRSHVQAHASVKRRPRRSQRHCLPGRWLVG